MRIDVHAHYYDQRFTETMHGHGTTWTGWSSAPGRDVTLEDRLELMDEAGIGLQVLCVGAHQPYLPDLQAATAAARFANDYYRQVVERGGRRLAAFGCVPLPHVDAALAEAARCLDELGMRGINVGCSVAGRALDDPEFEPFWAELERRHAVAFLHPLGAGVPLSEAYGLTWMVGGCFEDTIAALRLVLSGLTTRHSRVKIVVPHLGGTLPFLWQRLADVAERQRAARGQEGGIDLKAAAQRLYFDTVNEEPAALRCACDTVGPSRLMLGTDFPFLAGPKFKRCVTYVQEAGLPGAVVDQILETNAQQLLG
jgi:predicted TIM-barrel fold metal-dependent hydrolase